jgi:tetratricopeptide (TPR) repeat protein
VLEVRESPADFWWRLATERGESWGPAQWGLYLEMRGDLVEAEDAYRRAVESGETSVMDSYGRLLGRRGKLREAEHWYRRIVDAEPDASYAMDNLAEILLEQGDRTGAEQWWRRAAEGRHVGAAVNLNVLLESSRLLLTEDAVRDHCEYAEELVGDRRAEEAVSVFRAALRAAETVVGRDAELTVEIRAALAALATEIRHPVAERAWRGVVADLDRLAGPDSAAALVARGRLAELLVLLERQDDAVALYRELLPRAVAVLGPEHPLTRAATAATATG